MLWNLFTRRKLSYQSETESISGADFFLADFFITIIFLVLFCRYLPTAFLLDNKKKITRLKYICIHLLWYLFVPVSADIFWHKDFFLHVLSFIASSSLRGSAESLTLYTFSEISNFIKRGDFIYLTAFPSKCFISLLFHVFSLHCFKVSINRSKLRFHIQSAVPVGWGRKSTCAMHSILSLVWKDLFQYALHSGVIGESLVSAGPHAFTVAQRFPQSISLFYDTRSEGAKGWKRVFLGLYPSFCRKLLLWVLKSIKHWISCLPGLRSLVMVLP